MKITIELENVYDATEHQIRYLLADAIYEFAANRGPTPTAYVNNRYPDNKEYAWTNREEKIKEVTKRVNIALELHKSVLINLKAE